MFSLSTQQTRRWPNIGSMYHVYRVPDEAGNVFLNTCTLFQLLKKTRVKPHPARLIYLNFHPLEVVSRYRDPQLQVSENYL